VLPPIEAIDGQNRQLVRKFVAEQWGSSLIVSRGRVHHADELPGFVAFAESGIQGLVTYDIRGMECEIVTLHSMLENKGMGTALINRVVEVARAHGCKRLWLITTNDNSRAFRFYQRRGLVLCAVHLYAIAESRKIKPEIPLTGFDGIPILHEIEFEMMLG